MHLPLVLRVVDLPQLVREELHGGVRRGGVHAAVPPRGFEPRPLSVAKPAGGLRRRV
jgi:hypothetical protein